MTRKNRVWLITLIVLLVASIVGLFLVKKQWDASESNYVQASTQLTEEQASSEKLRTELDETQTSLDAKTTEAEALQTNLDAKTTEAETLQADLDAKNAENETLKADLETANTNLTACQTELESTQASLTEAKTSINSLEGQVAHLTEVTGERDAANAKIVELQDSLDAANEQVTSLGTQISETQADNETAKTKIAELQTALDTANTRVAELSAVDPSSTDQTISELQAALQEAEGRINELEASLTDSEEMAAEIVELKASLQTAEDKVTELNISMDALKNEVRNSDMQRAIEEAEEHYEIYDFILDNQEEKDNAFAEALMVAKNASDALRIALNGSASSEEEEETLNAALADAGLEMDADQFFALTGAELMNAKEALNTLMETRLAALEAAAGENAVGGLDHEGIVARRAELGIIDEHTALANAQTRIDELEELVSGENDLLPQIDMEKIRTDLDAIVNGDMTDAEKVEAIAVLETELETVVSALETSAAQLSLRRAEFTDAQTSLQTMREELTVAQENLTKIETRLSESNHQIAVLEEQVTALTAQGTADASAIAELTAQLTEAQNESASLTTQLTEAQAQVETLTAALDETQTQLATAQTQLTERETESSNLSAQLTEAQSEIDSLREQLAQAQAEKEALAQELSDTRETLNARIAALEAYLIERELGAGEAHSSTTASTTIAIAADGVTGNWDYTNNLVSGNSVVLSIVMNDTELFRSETLKPETTLSEIRLNTALEPGSYEAKAVTEIYAKDGALLFASAIPVTLEVAE